jgi:hypothetical protein
MNKIIALSIAVIFLTACTSTPPQLIPTPTPDFTHVTEETAEPTVQPIAQQTQQSAPSTQGKATWETYEKVKNNDTAFSGYTIQYPKTWTKKVEENQAISDFILSKEQYSITIRQAGMDADKCALENSTKIESVMGPLIRVKGYSPNKESINYNVCGKSVSADAYINPTSVGLITVKGPITEDQARLIEVDSILKTIIKK